MSSQPSRKTGGAKVGRTLAETLGSNPTADPSLAAKRLRWMIYCLLIALAVGQATGRLMAVNSVDKAQLESYRINQRMNDFKRELASRDLTEDQIAEKMQTKRADVERKLKLQRPFLSANDRSRWLAIRALVEHGTFAIDQVLEEPTWDTIDMVQHRGLDGQLHQYSSKPPLLYVLLAGEYWLINKATGATLGTHPYAIGRAMLFTINIIPMAIMLLMIAALAERFGKTDWGRLFVVAVASFGTMLSAFAVVLNNHLVAAVAVSIALYAWARIRHDGDTRGRWFLLAGLMAAFTAANELPALAFLVFLGLMLLLRHRRETLIWFTPAAAVVMAAFFITNYIAHNDLRPPYAHRNADKPGTSAQHNDDWYRYEYTVNGRTRQSYWNSPGGLDVGEPSIANYTFHCLVGHHGLFSMTPVWVLSMLGGCYWLARRADLFGIDPQRELAALVLSLTIICLVFYLGLRPQVDRNYGGNTNGLRWLFWFAPLWCATMLPAVDWLSKSRWGQTLGLILLAISAFSASYPTWNPWTQPWIYNLLEWLGRI